MHSFSYGKWLPSLEIWKYEGTQDACQLEGCSAVAPFRTRTWDSPVSGIPWQAPSRFAPDDGMKTLRVLRAASPTCCQPVHAYPSCYWSRDKSAWLSNFFIFILPLIQIFQVLQRNPPEWILSTRSSASAELPPGFEGQIPDSALASRILDINTVNIKYRYISVYCEM